MSIIITEDQAREYKELKQKNQGDLWKACKSFSEAGVTGLIIKKINKTLKLK